MNFATDSFYRGLIAEEAQRVHGYDFDHPDAFDSELLAECIEKLKNSMVTMWASQAKQLTTGCGAWTWSFAFY
ncbi:hypothetical protein LOK49_Contig52G00004 [Camellia lanceoleosa]|nr:hypothetical protein LOK49_Contig52G00004 [Camellia lanceoleosa]